MNNISRLFRIALLVFLLPATWSCVKEMEEKQEAEELYDVIFHAGWDAETKTVLQEDGSVFWSPGDEISLFVGDGSNGGYKLTSTNTEPAAKADFVGQIGEHANGASYVAVYPYNESNFVYADKLYINLPSNQVAKEETFDNSSFFSVAFSDDDVLYFHNVCSGIKFSVYNEDVKELVICNYDNQYAWNPFREEIKIGSVKNSIACDICAPQRITITAPEGRCFKKDTYYYAIVPSGESNATSITFVKNDDTKATILCHEPITFKKSVFKRFYEMDKGLAFKKSVAYISVPHNQLYNMQDGMSVDKSVITDIYFHPSDNTVTEHLVSRASAYDVYGTEPIYFKQEGTVAHYYTAADSFEFESVAGAFCELPSLRNISALGWDTSKATDFSGMFVGCTNLREIDLGFLDTSNAIDMTDMFLGCLNLENVNLSGFNTSKVENMCYMFCRCENLKILDLSNFDTGNVKDMFGMFEDCRNLKQLDISSFTSTSLRDASGLFNRCYMLMKLDLGGFDISKSRSLSVTCRYLAHRSKNCAIRCIPVTKDALLSSETLIGSDASYITWFSLGETLPDYQRYFDPNLYYSTDYSRDEKIQILQHATEGNGINLVVMGDAYSDRLINNGTYDNDVQKALNALFSKEPFKSYKHLFNIYKIYLVSENEVSGEYTSLDYYDEGNRFDPNGGTVDRNDEKIKRLLFSATGVEISNSVGLVNAFPLVLFSAMGHPF